MASKHDAMVFLQQNAEIESMCNDKATAAGVIRRALRVLKNITNVPIYEFQISSSDVTDKNVATAEFGMKAGRKGKSELANNKISPDKEDRQVALTSVLITPNMVPCEVHDIDSSDADNQFALVEYVEDLYKFYKIAEKSNQPRDYMDTQVEINAEMRAIVSNWLIQVHEKYQLMPETLYLTFQIMDRYLSIETVKRRKLQLVGITSMLIACKYEETRGSPHVDELASISRKAYNRSKILKMEKEILNKLDWSLTVPAMYVFLVRFIKAARGDKQMEEMTFFFSELALINYSMIMYKPSMIAASAVYAARCTLKMLPFWTKTLEYHTGFKSYQLVNCAAELVRFHTSETAVERMKAKKYSRLHYDAVTLNTPTQKILEILKNTLVRLFEKVVGTVIDLEMSDDKLSS